MKTADAAKNDVADKTSAQTAPVSSEPSGNTFTFKRSPFATDVLTPTAEVAASTSQLALNQSQACGTQDEEERLCVVCEVGKKNILLMPCKHICLCKSCADSFLSDKIKECPMCRTKIQDSTEVFW